MRYRCTAKVERHTPRSESSRETWQIRVGCIPVRDATPGNHFRSLDVALTLPNGCERWDAMSADERHRRVESYVRSFVQQQGLRWIQQNATAGTARLDVDQSPVDWQYQDPGDPFELAAS